MSKWTVRKQFKFEAAHQLTRSFSRECTDSIHGHSYVVEVFLRTSHLDACDMAMDFGLLKLAFQPIFDAWDHALILPQQLANEYGRSVRFREVCHKLVSVPFNPTAEAMAQDIHRWMLHELRSNRIREHAQQFLPLTSDLALSAVRVQETVTGWGQYESETQIYV